MKIVIDGRMYGLENAGIGRYINNLIEQIGNLDKENEYFILLRKKYFNLLKFKSTNFKKILADYPHYSLLEQIPLLLQLMKLKPDLVHFPHFNVPVFYFGKYVVTIHDLIKHTSRGMATTTRSSWFYWLKYLGYRLVFGQAVKRATKILVPSQFVKEDLEKEYGLPGGKIAVTYEGIGETFKQSSIIKKQSSIILTKYKIVKPFVIYTGSLYPHKNVERLAEAVKCSNDLYHDSRNLSLALVCARSVFYERFKRKIEQMEAGNCVKMVGFVPDEDLTILYQEAETFVFPSLSEGFGLPGLEAMSCGCPVVCSDIPVLREIYGEAALYFNPYESGDIAEKIKKVISDMGIRDTLIKRGLEQVKKYSWQKMAKETLAVYNREVSKNEGR